MKHHYVPQFYLAQWSGADGKLWRYRKEYGNRVSEKAVAPRGTAFEPDLYAVTDSWMNPSGDPHILEVKSFGPIDTGGSTALSDLLVDTPTLRSDVREKWALFLNSLVHRHASNVQHRDTYSRQLADAVKANMLASSPCEESREQLEAILSGLNVHSMARDIHRGVMIQKIHEPDSIAHLLALKWNTVSAPPNRPFITTDRPLLLNLGAGGPVDLITMALSPAKLFLGYPASWADGKELVELRQTLVNLHNFLLLRSTPQCVYSANKLVDQDGYRLHLAVHQVLLEGGSAAATSGVVSQDGGGL